MNIDEIMYNERLKAFRKSQRIRNFKIKLFIIIILGIVGFFGLYYAFKSNAESQWDKESKLYIQGYLDGKKEVLDSIKNQ